MFRLPVLKRFAAASLLLSAGVPAPASADDAPSGENQSQPQRQPQNLSGQASLGVLNTNGNTNARTVNGKLTLTYTDGLWGHSGTATALNSEKDRTTTDERYGLAYKGTYELSARNYAFGSLSYDNDRFAGITERKTEAGGYGWHLINRPQHVLDAEAGGGATQQTLAGGETQNSAVALANAKYQWLISDTSKFTQTVKIERGRRNTSVNPLTELKLVIAGNLFTTLSYELRYNSEVPDGTLHTDSLTAVNLGYAFGKNKQ
jgi:putative salt-induced outer membrane protein